MTQKGATNLTSEYNVSANNNNTEYTFAQAVALVPVSLQKGGLTIKYIDSTTHEYAIKRLMSSTWNTTESNWQGIDDEPTAGSNNLVKSGGVAICLLGTIVTGGLHPYNLEQGKKYLFKNLGSSQAINIFAKITESSENIEIKRNVSSGDSFIYEATTNSAYINISNIPVEVRILNISDILNSFIADFDTAPTKGSTHLILSGAVEESVSQILNSIQWYDITTGTINYHLEAGKIYMFTNTGSFTGNIFYKKTSESSNVLIGSVAQNEIIEFTATEDSDYLVTSNVPTFKPKVCNKDSLLGNIISIGEISKWNNSIIISKVFEKQITFGQNVFTEYKMQQGKTYVFINKGTSQGSVYYKVYDTSEGQLIGSVSVNSLIEYTAIEDSNYLYESYVPGLNIWVCEKNSLVQSIFELKVGLSALIPQVALNTKQYEYTSIDAGGNFYYPLTSGKTYLIINEGTADGKVYYRDASDENSILICSLTKNELFEYMAITDSTYLRRGNVPGFSPIICEKDTIFGSVEILKHKPQIETFIINVGTYNTGDFTGDGIVTPSQEGALAYRKLIGSLNVNLLATQEDTRYYGGMDSGDEVRSTIFPMYKNYYREGTSQFNFKAFASDYPITQLEKILYTDGNYTHYYFLKGVVNGDIMVASIHFDWQDVTRRRKQINQVISYFNSYDKVIIMGDTNPDNLNESQIIDPDNLLIYDEEWTIFANAGYSMANNGEFGLINTGTSFLMQYAWAPIDNIFVKGGTIRNVWLGEASFLNDHKPLCATVVF